MGFNMVSFTPPKERLEELKACTEVVQIDKDYILTQIKSGVKILPYSHSATSEEDTFFYEDYVDGDANFHTIFITKDGEFICGYKYYDDSLAHTLHVDNMWYGNPLAIDYESLINENKKFHGVASVKTQLGLIDGIFKLGESGKFKKYKKHLEKNIDYKKVLKHKEKIKGLDEHDVVLAEEFDEIWGMLSDVISDCVNEEIVNSFMGNVSDFANISDIGGDKNIFEIDSLQNDWKIARNNIADKKRLEIDYQKLRQGMDNVSFNHISELTSDVLKEFEKIKKKEKDEHRRESMQLNRGKYKKRF